MKADRLFKFGAGDELTVIDLATVVAVQRIADEACAYTLGGKVLVPGASFGTLQSQWRAYMEAKDQE